MTNGTLPHGWTISSRLMACWTFNDGSTIEVSAPAYRLVNGDGVQIAEDTDFRPSVALKGWTPVLEEFMGFLTSYSGECDHGPTCPFPAGWHEWCTAHEQELTDLRDMLDPDGQDDA